MRQQEKRLLILEAAIRRFGHFGIAKTTMAEIAQDLDYSKALLYYYYPDKNSLYAAALEYVIKQAYDTISAKLESMSDYREAVLWLVHQRMDFVIKNYNLLEYSVGTMQQMPKEIWQIFARAQEQQEALVASALRRGVEAGQFRPIDNVEELSRVLLLSLEGMRLSVLRKSGEGFFPSKEEFDGILHLQVKMISVMLDGLSA